MKLISHAKLDAMPIKWEFLHGIINICLVVEFCFSVTISR